LDRPLDLSEARPFRKNSARRQPRLFQPDCQWKLRDEDARTCSVYLERSFYQLKTQRLPKPSTRQATRISLLVGIFKH